ncbi:MAG: sigma-70 family RNA polymerase sigma factor [Oscillospiraceae bacterium]|jgi:RNA polymerase sporulation-specific sigma factor|nr:sigma-70 family RNA polymerase sigma factor [Oscillospiraceae bacterium]
MSLSLADEDQERAILDNTGLIWSVARRFFGRGVDPDDLYQLGCIGLIKAWRGFDPDYGTQFSTYAVPKIAGEIRRFLRDDGAIKVSRGIKEQASHVRSARHTLEQSLGRSPTLSELAAETGITVEDIAAAETAVTPPDSFSRETDDGFTLEQVLTEPGAEEKLIEHVALRGAIETLPEREKLVIALRYSRGMTQDTAARVLKCSQVQVSRLERRALERLRGNLDA